LRWNAYWGQCYDHYFRRLCPIFVGVFLQNQCCDPFLA
jgi:hypothetical protein